MLLNYTRVQVDLMVLNCLLQKAASKTNIFRNKFYKLIFFDLGIFTKPQKLGLNKFQKRFPIVKNIFTKWQNLFSRSFS